jgi:DNA repair exonuclease SbcCD ATPase subunit
MRPLHTTIQGFGPHVDTNVDWASIGSPCAIQGRNGTGKTFLVEADFATLYGYFPSYGMVYAGLRSNGEGEGVLQATFEFHGVRWRATRNVTAPIGKRPNQTALLERWANSYWLKEAGPKVTEFQLRVDTLFGDDRVALATWMGAQRRVGDIVELEPARRRELFASFLALEDLSTTSRELTMRADAVQREAAMLHAQAMDIGELQEQEIRLVEELSQAEEQERVSRRALNGAQLNRSEALRELDTIAEDEKECRAIVAGADVAARNCVDADREVQHARINVENAQREADQAIVFEIDTIEEDWLLGRKQRYREQEVAFKAYLDWQSEHHRLERDVEYEEETSSRMIETKPDTPTELDKKNAGQLEFAEEQVRIGRAENEKIKARNSEARRARTEIETQVNLLEEMVQHEPTKPTGLCDICPAMKNYNADLQKHQQRVRDLEALKAKIVAPLKVQDEIDTHQWRDVADTAKVAAERIRKNEDWKKQHAAQRTRTEAARQAVKDHKAIRPEKVDDPAEKMLSCDKQLWKLGNPRQNLAKALHFEKLLPQLQADLASHQMALSHCQSVEQAHADMLPEAKRKLAGFDADRMKWRTIASEAAREVNSLTSDLTSASSAAASARERLLHCKEGIAKATERIDRAKSLDAKTKRLATLARVYGPRGVQPLLVDHATPGIEMETDKVLREITSGQMSLRFCTQSEKKDGAMREVMLILARDMYGERDVSQFSGGEQCMLRTALRIGMSDWLARYVGTKPEQVTVDEFLDNLDDENSESMVQMAYGLAPKFACVRIVTHSLEFATRLPARVLLQKSAAGYTEVVQVTSCSAPAGSH